jgi:glutaconate CoA-transferase subunit B
VEDAASIQPRLARTADDLMVVAAAREIADGEIVFPTFGLSFLAWLLAKKVHAPSARGLLEDGSLRDAAPEHLSRRHDDPALVTGASGLGGLQHVLGLLQQGRVDVGIVEAGMVDRHGNIGAPGPLKARDGAAAAAPPTGAQSPGTPGPGIVSDICALARRTIIIVRHERQRLVERVPEIIAAGYGDGGDWRRRLGLPGGGPAAIVTDLAVFRFDPSGVARLASLQPGVAISEVEAATGWQLGDRIEVPTTPAPTVFELNMLEQFDAEA